MGILMVRVDGPLRYGPYVDAGGVEYPTGRFLRDARLYCVGAGTQEIRRMLIGREFNDEFKRRSS